MGATPSEIVNQAIDALRRLDRRGAASLLRSLIAQDAALGQSWKSVATLADRIGEIDVSVEAMRRYAQSEPRSLDKFLAYMSELATRGRSGVVDAALAALPPALAERTEITHLRATLATQHGEFALAESLARRTIAEAPLTGQNWLGLSMIKRFRPGDADIAAMRRIEPGIGKSPPASQAAFYYALGKALHDAKDYDAAFDAYSRGAAVKRAEEPFDGVAVESFARSVVENCNADSLGSLRPSRCDSSRAIFVTGLPRSGTTLVEQILTSHSAVIDGAELNLFRAALHPVGDLSMKSAGSFNDAPPASYDAADPWGSIAEDYHGFLSQRFGDSGRIVDKTLNHSRIMGLILHALPAARVVWLRRDPEDNAISVFRNYFASAIPWSWSLADIGRYFRTEDMLHAHWSKEFPEHILTVPYEALTREPDVWIGRILSHVGLPQEAAVFEPHKQDKRSVLTASVAQVREPISTAQIGAARKYERHMSAFREAYSG